MLEQVQEMGPHFRYSGDHSEDNQYFFDLSGALMITGWEMMVLMRVVVRELCFHPKWALSLQGHYWVIDSFQYHVDKPTSVDCV